MPPVVAARPACRFGDGLAIGPDLEGAGRSRWRRRSNLWAAWPRTSSSSWPQASPLDPVPSRAGRRVMDAAGAVTRSAPRPPGSSATGVAWRTAPVAVWAATLPGARMRPFRLTMRTTDGPSEVDLPPAENDDSVVALLVDPHTFPVAGFLRDNGTLPVVGGLASARGGPGSNRLFLDGEVHAHGGVGLLVGGEIRTRTLVSHGCRPIGPPMTVTRAERNVLLELAGAPALQRLSEVVDALPVPRRRAAARALQLGVVVDEYADEHARGDFLVRGILGADEMTGAVAVGDVIEVGRTVRFQVRDAGSAAEDLGAALPAADPARRAARCCSPARLDGPARPAGPRRARRAGQAGRRRGGRAAGRGGDRAGRGPQPPPREQHRGPCPRLNESWRASADEPEEAPHLVDERLRLLQRREVAADGRFGPVAQVGEPALHPVARQPRELAQELGDPGRHLDRVHTAASVAPSTAAPTTRGGGQPVEHHVVEQAIASDAVERVARTVRPVPELLDDPRAERGEVDQPYPTVCGRVDCSCA